MSNARRALIVFAKEPALGKVKTRLESALSQRACLGLYRAFLGDVLSAAGGVSCEGRFVAWEASGREPVFLRRSAPSFLFFQQQGSGLGQRMERAFGFVFREGFERAVIIGSDAPDLPAAYVTDAFRRLRTHDLVLGPAADGGFYLIGLNKLHDGLFLRVRWSSSSVVQKILANARTLRLAAALLPLWHDVDDRASLETLIGRLAKDKLSPVGLLTREYLRQIAYLKK